MFVEFDYGDNIAPQNNKLCGRDNKVCYLGEFFQKHKSNGFYLIIYTYFDKKHQADKSDQKRMIR